MKLKKKSEYKNIKGYCIWYFLNFISNLDLFPLISPGDIVSTSELTPTLKTIGQSNVNLIMIYR